MYDITYMGILGFSTIEKIAKSYVSYYGDIDGDEKEIERIGKAVLASYQDGIKKGYPIFSDTDDRMSETTAILNYVKQQTGFSAVIIYRYLSTVEREAKAGNIDYQHYNPGAPTKADTTKLIQIPESITETVKRQFEGFNVLDGLNQQFNKILVVGAVVAVSAIAINAMIAKSQARR